MAWSNPISNMKIYSFERAPCKYFSRSKHPQLCVLCRQVSKKWRCRCRVYRGIGKGSMSRVGDGNNAGKYFWYFWSEVRDISSFRLKWIYNNRKESCNGSHLDIGRKRSRSKVSHRHSKKSNRLGSWFLGISLDSDSGWLGILSLPLEALLQLLTSYVYIELLLVSISIHGSRSRPVPHS